MATQRRQHRDVIQFPLGRRRCVVTKRLVDIDDVLEAARRALPYAPTPSRDTVKAALRDSVHAATRREHRDRAALARLAAASKDLIDEDVMASAQGRAGPSLWEVRLWAASSWMAAMSWNTSASSASWVSSSWA